MWLQWWLSSSPRPVAPPVLALSFMAPVSVAPGSSICCCCCLSWCGSSTLLFARGSSLQYLLSFMTPVLAPVFVARGFSIGGFVVHGSSLQYLSIACGFSSICISCRSWLQYLSLLAPVFVVLSCGSNVSFVVCVLCRLWLRYLLSISSCCGSSRQYLLIACGSSICRACLQYHYLSLVAPLVVACGSSICCLWLSSHICISCRSWL